MLQNAKIPGAAVQNKWGNSTGEALRAFLPRLVASHFGRNENSLQVRAASRRFKLQINLSIWLKRSLGKDWDTLENPWVNYDPPANEVKFHNLDKNHALSFNKVVGENEAIRLTEHLEPSPFTGNPQANVFVLLANPGVSEKEANPAYRMNEEKKIINLRNLRHEDVDSLRFRIHSPEKPELESNWFQPRVRSLVKQTSVERVASGVFFLNFHGYHSKSWYPIPFTFATQHYSFYLVEQAISRYALIVMSRNLLGWFTAVPQLYDYPNRVSFKSSRSVHLSEGNLGSENYLGVVQRL